MAGALSDEEAAEVQRQFAAALGALNGAPTGIQQCECLQDLAALAKVLLPGRPLPDPVGLARAIRPLLSQPSAYLRAAALRCMRHFARDPHFIAACWRYKLDWWVARTIDRVKSEKERDQALRFVRSVVDAIGEASRWPMEEREVPPAVLRETWARACAGTATGDGEPAMPFLFPAFSSQVSTTSLDTSTLLNPSMEFTRSINTSLSADTSRGVARTPGSDSRLLELPYNLLQRITSVAETADDPMRKMCVLMLRDYAPYRFRALCQTHGVRAMVQAIVDPRLEDVAPSLTLTLLWALDKQATRRNLRLSLDLQGLLAPFVERMSKDPKELMERMKAATGGVLLMLRTWAGLVCFTNDPHALRTLVDVLRAPGPAPRRAMLFDLFTQAVANAAPHRVLPQFIALGTGEHATRGTDSAFSSGGGPGRRAAETSTMSFNDVGDPAADHPFASELASENSRRLTVVPYAGYNALDTFLGALLLALDHSGLTNALVDIVQDPSDDLASMQASRLLQLMLGFADTLFPRDFSLRMHGSLDRVLAAMMHTTRRLLLVTKERVAEDEGKERSGETTEERCEGQRQNHKVLSMVTALYQSLQATQRQSCSNVTASGEGLPFQMAVMVDDGQLRILLNEAYILATKDFTRWNTERILVLLRGPLRSHPRLVEALKTKFFKRQLSFLRPSKRLFAEMPYREEHLIWALIGCRVIELLLLSAEGRKYLLNSNIFTEIHQCLEAELGTKADAAPAPDRVFSKERIAYSMSREYIRFIGRCTESANGLELLQTVGVLQTLAALTEASRNRGDLCHQVLKFLHFGRVDGAPPNEHVCRILENAMGHSSKPIRYFATTQLRQCLKPECGMSDPLNRWCVDHLLQRMDDGWKDVALCAYQILEEACSASDECLEYLIDKGPSVEKLGEHNRGGLLMRMLHVSAGFRYLFEKGWVQSQMLEWRAEGAAQYVYTLESEIQRAMSDATAAPCGRAATPSRARGLSGSFSIETPPLPSAAALGALPLHFYGELCSTPEGLAFFTASRVFDELAHAIAANAVGPAPDDADPDPEFANASDSEDSDSEEKNPALSFELFHALGETSQYHKECIQRMLAQAEADLDTQQQVSRRTQVVRREGVFCTQPLSSAYTPVASAPTRALRIIPSLALRAALWGLGHVGGSTHGLPLLLEANLIEGLTDLALYADCLSVRGTAMSVLGLIGRSAVGREALSRLKWYCHHCCDGYVGQDGLAYSVCLAFPVNHRALLSLPEGRGTRPSMLPSMVWSTPPRRGLRPGRVRVLQGDPSLCNSPGAAEASVLTGVLHTPSAPQSPTTSLNAEILKAVKSLSNPVMQDQASRELKRLRQQHPTAFQNPLLAADIYALMSVYRYRPNARRFLYEFLDGAIFTPRALDMLDQAHGLALRTPSEAERHLGLP